MKIKDLEFKVIRVTDTDILRSAKVPDFCEFTVLDRATASDKGMSRDIETVYRDSSGDMWLRESDFDIRRYRDLTIEQGIEEVKKYGECITTGGRL